MHNILLRCGIIVTCMFCFGSLSAQDMHFSQFHNSPLNHNPALTGIFSGDQRFSGMYRRQWFSVPVDYLTFSGAYDMKFRPDGASSFWSAGAMFNYDRAGDSKLSMAQLALSGSYTVGLTQGFLITAGVQAGGGQRSLRTADLTWGNYWDGSGVDPSKGSGEPDFDESRFYFDLGAGINFRLQKSSRTRLDLGFGAFHLTRPNSTFYTNPTEDVNLPVRMAIQAYGSLELFPMLDLRLNGLYHLVGPFQEIVAGGLLNIHISRKKARELQLAVGAAVRIDDAIIPMIELAYDGWRAGFSYDINTSAFEVATSGRGGPEFSLTYIITHVRPVDQSKICRIF